MTAKNTLPKPVMLRTNEDDEKLIELLQDKLGVSAASEVLRMGLRALATKEGVSI